MPGPVLLQHPLRVIVLLVESGSTQSDRLTRHCRPLSVDCQWRRRCRVLNWKRWPSIHVLRLVRRELKSADVVVETRATTLVSCWQVLIHVSTSLTPDENWSDNERCPTATIRRSGSRHHIGSVVTCSAFYNSYTYCRAQWGKIVFRAFFDDSEFYTDNSSTENGTVSRFARRMLTKTPRYSVRSAVRASTTCRHVVDF